MTRKKHNLLDTVDLSVKEVADRWQWNNAFAFEQLLSDAVKVVRIYSDDADICFHFEVEGHTVEIYCNYPRTGVCGYVHNCTELTATRLLKMHFGLDVVYCEGNDMVWFEATQEKVTT